ncbi:MAG: DNA repair protein RecN, partial [Alphaproteobacteria bacterium]|nr:DNA repair protein RecN [Alphaproteobacteria bacterium]
AETALMAAREALDTAACDQDWLTHAVAELRTLAPIPGEEAALAERRAVMQRGAKITDDLTTILALVEDSDGGLNKLRMAARSLDRIQTAHPKLAEALQALDAAIISGAEAEDMLRAGQDALAYDPARLEEDEARLFDLRAVARKHRVQPDDLAALAEEFAARLAAIEMGSEGLAAREAEVAAAREAYVQAAQAFSAARTSAATRLDSAVNAELVPLKLDAAKFRTVLTPLPETQWGPHGTERVAFEIATNPGAPFAPLAKIASGGELSRFILALKVALAQAGGAATMVFDEIDRGVGGAVASAVGQRLARLAAGSQVLVVTHSPQVAARGSQHLLIAKASDGQITRTSVHALNAHERREEIARMLSGAHITDEARAQAERLIV